jgi:hypothetical protein
MNALVAKLIRYDWFIRMQSRYSEVVPELACMPSERLCGSARLGATISRAKLIADCCGAQ